MISKEANGAMAQLNGLVLAGGKSSRMGQDKSIMQWHSKEQRYYAADLLKDFCSKVYISCRADQQHEIDAAYTTLADTYTGIGPYGAILTALTKTPAEAWLVIACDLPLIDTATLQYLISNRDPGCIATTYESPFDGLPEPLITIWEPASLAVLLSFLSEGYKCPRKALIKNMKQVKMLLPPDANALLNANTPEDAEKVKMLMDNKTIDSHAP